MARSTKSKATIFDDLLEASGVTKGKGESTEKFKTKLFQAVDDLPDAKFEAMPTATQEFFNEAIRAMGGKDGHDKGTLLTIPGYDDEEKDEPKKASGRERIRDEEEEQTETAPASRGRGRPAKVKAEPEKAVAKGAAGKANGKGTPAKKAAATKADPKERKPREINRTGSVYKIKEAILKKPSASAKEIHELLVDKLGDDAPTQSTVQGIRSDFIHSMHVLNDKGKLGDVAGFAD